MCLKWEGYVKIFGANNISSDAILGGEVKLMNEPGSLINPENLDRLVRSQRIFGSAMSGIDRPLLKALEKMVESEYPCCLVTLEGTKQLWINHKMLQRELEVDVEEGIGRDLTSLWLPGDLEEVVKEVASCNITTGFNGQYVVTIFPPERAKFDYHFERVESVVGTCRLTTIKDFEKVA